MKAMLFTDGGSRGNPGPSAYAFVLEAEDGEMLAAEGEAIGTATNNVAEYRGLLAGLKRAVELGVKELVVVSDSELMVKQLRGEYRVRNEGLQPLVDEAKQTIAEFQSVEFRHVPRAENAMADEIVNRVLDEQS